MTNVEGEARLLVMRPLGSQGPKVGIELSCREDFVRFDEEMGKLSENERKTQKGIKQAAREAKLPIVDF